jgi:hypothetical protein
VSGLTGLFTSSLRSTLDVFEEYQDVDVVSYMPTWRCLVLPLIILINYEALRRVHLIHPKTPLLKRLTWSMPMFSGTWTRRYQKEAITFHRVSIS